MPSDSTRLAGKRILITGAAQGIGAAAARRCAAEGAALVLVDRDERVHAVAEETGALAYIGDVADRATCDGHVAAAVEHLGGLDALANVAGVHRNGTAADLDDDTWDLVMGVNVKAPFMWTRAALPHLIDAGGGAIVNLASVASTHAIANSVAYVTSKTALLGLTRSVARDFARQGVRCNAICPGSVETEFLRAYMDRNPTTTATLLEGSVAGRFGQPDDVAACCAYLLADESAFVNGAAIAIDGGRTAAD